MSQKSDYLNGLLVENPDVAERYLMKIAKINNTDPFSLADDVMSYETAMFPKVTNMDIVSYLVLTTSYYTQQQMKAFKSLHAYKYFEAGFVHKCCAIKLQDYIVVTAQVKHSQKMNAAPLKVWIMCQEDGSVETGHCTCMAGAGEVCSHVGALLYALEYIQSQRENTSCTDTKAMWNVPTTSKINYEPLKNMDFGNVISSRKLAAPVPPISSEEMVEMLHKIEEVGSSSVLMRVVEPFASEMVTSEEFLPNIYNDLYQSEFEALGLTELLELSAHKEKELMLDPAQCAAIEEATRKQAASEKWFQQRAGRITASNFKRVCRTSTGKPSLSLIKNICYPTRFMFKTKATVWGTVHEKDGLAAYESHSRLSHPDLVVQSEIGLCVSPQHPQFGASPDAMVSCGCCNKGCVEVKCPYLLKNKSLDDFASLGSSCLLKSSDGQLSLKKDHSYFFQIQMQMAMTDVYYCDFVVWSPKELFIERILFDKDFWSREAPRAVQFHYKVILPELLGRAFTRGNILSETWCICRGIDDGQAMLCCDNDNCDIKWYHLQCVGLENVPENIWICDSCINPI